MEPLVLIVEDDPLVLEIIESNLLQDGWRVVSARNSMKALQLLAGTTPDIIILDLLLPGSNGLELCRHIRSGKSSTPRDIPILMLSALAMQTDKLAGFDAGTDDYLTKPFDPRELNARLQALLKRSRADNDNPNAGPLKVGVLELEPYMRRATFQGKCLELKPQEFDLLHALAQEPGRVFTRDELLKNVWNYSAVVDSRTVDVHISNLRRKLIVAAPQAKELITTVYGTGYKLEVLL